jgi:hypothetical protein
LRTATSIASCKATPTTEGQATHQHPQSVNNWGRRVACSSEASPVFCAGLVGQPSLKRALPSRLACLLGGCAWVGGGRCTSSSLPLVSTPRHSKIWGINNAVSLHHAVRQSSCQPDTLYDQLERLKQVAVIELDAQTLLVQ